MNKIIYTTAFSCGILASGLSATPVFAQQPEIKLIEKSAIAQSSQPAITNPAREQAQENLTKTLIILGLILGMGSLGWYLTSRSATPLASFQANQGKNNSSKKALLDRVSPRLRRKLLRLVNDPKTANRLLLGIYKHNRDRSANWIAEKAIYDLQRGR